MFAFPSLQACFRKAYSVVFFRGPLLLLLELTAHAFAFFLIKIDGVLSVYCAGSMARRDAQPGESDIDLIVLLKDCSDEKELVLIRKVAKRFERLNSFLGVGSLLYMLSPRDIRTLERISGYLYIFNPSQWRLLSGKKTYAPPLSLRVPVNNLGLLLSAKMWQDTLLERFFTRDPRHKTAGLREFSSLAFKVCRLLAYANRKAVPENLFDPSPYSFLEEIPDEFLKEKCLEFQKKRPLKNQDVEFHVAEICARTMSLLDREAQKSFEKQLFFSVGKTFARHPLPLKSIGPVIQKAFKQTAAVLLESADLIVHHKSTYHILLNPDLPPDVLLKTLASAKQSLRELPQPHPFKISTPCVFSLGITTDPIGHSAFLRTAQVYARNAEGYKLFLAPVRPEKIFFSFYCCVFAKNSAFLLGKEKRIVHLKFVLASLLQCRLFLDKEVLAAQGEEAEKYGQAYGQEPATPDIVAALSREKAAGFPLERLLWTGCNYLANKIYARLGSQQ